MAALGERDDWQDLKVYGALLGVGHRALQPRERPLPLGLLRPVRARAPRRRREHLVRRCRLPPLRAAPRGAEPARHGDRGRATRLRGLVLAFPPRRRHIGRDDPRRRGPDRASSSSRPLRTTRAPSASLPSTCTRSRSTRSTSSSRATAHPCRSPTSSRLRPTSRSRSTRPRSSRTGRRFRPASERFPRRSPPGSRRETRAISASTPRCSPTG